MTDRQHDDDLRRLLHDAVSDVDPHGSPDDLRRRADEGTTTMNRTGPARWLPLSVAAAAAMVLIIGGTLWLTDRDGGNPPVATDGNSTPTAATSPSSPSSSTASPAPGREVAVPVYFVGETAAGPRLFREFQKQQVCLQDDCLPTAAATSVVQGQPADPDYRTLWPAGTTAAATFDGETITVDLTGDVHDRPAGMSQAQAGLAVQQLVYSVQGAVGQGRLPVQLLIGGKRTDQVLGVPASEPLAAGDPDSTLATVSITSPGEGAQVQSPFTVTGQAATFEANVVWELEQGDTVVRHGFTTAQECCTLSPYSFEVDAPPGAYTLVVHDTDMSDGEGIGTSQDTKEITVVQ